jgi:DNA-binding NarL/FixJ family response regulator
VQDESILVSPKPRLHKEIVMQTNKNTKIHVMHGDPLVSAGLMAILSDFSFLTTSSHHHEPQAYARQVGDRGDKQPSILIVTHLEKEGEVRVAIDSGVCGYVLQCCSPDELLMAVHHLSNGQRFLSETVAHCAAASLKRENLTPRETDVLQLLAKGCCNKTIARELGIGLGTVKAHVKGLFGKLDATARTHAVVIATQRGLIGAGHRVTALPLSTAYGKPAWQ